MGWLTLVRLTAVTFCATGGIPAADRGHPRPMLAQIVSDGGRIAEEQRPGNVRVTLTNGHREMWTRKGNCELARVSNSGLVGWTRGTAFHSKGALLNDTLIIAREDKILIRIRMFYPFIDVWDFADNESCVVVLSGGPHGPGRFEKFRIADGELLAGCYESADEQPKWAKRFLKKAREEGTYVE